MTTDPPPTGSDLPTWRALFERAPEHISEATIREMLAAHRNEDE